jgi:hypothetical protein
MIRNDQMDVKRYELSEVSAASAGTLRQMEEHQQL